MYISPKSDLAFSLSDYSTIKHFYWLNSFTHWQEKKKMVTSSCMPAIHPKDLPSTQLPLVNIKPASVCQNYVEPEHNPAISEVYHKAVIAVVVQLQPTAYPH